MKANDMIYALGSIVWYNGYYLEIQRWIEVGDKQPMWCVECPLEFPKHGTNNEYYDYGALQIIWMMCVCMFGDYGTSPRFGWVTDWHECRKFLEKICELSKEDNPADTD